ncbi:MAG: phosphoribosylaminoimidazolesuccinocarboxamide synthase [Candidatus Dormiibacterota bacterium]
MGAPLGELEIPGVPLFRRGKVRDTFDLGDRLLMVASDRLSAFDCVLPDLIPDRGRVLTALSRHWFARTAALVANHLLPDQPAVVPADVWERIGDRTMLVVKADRIDVECVVRGRLAGSGWEEYHSRGTLAEEPLPPGLEFGAALDPPRFTPATKSDSGHDQNISRAHLRSLLGEEVAARLEALSIGLFRAGREGCLAAGFDLVDTKFEFGWVGGRLTLIDELLTPDSSRFWELAASRGGADPQGFDKQPVRDWLSASGWDRRPPAPHLPPELVVETRRRYLEVLRRITGISL